MGQLMAYLWEWKMGKMWVVWLAESLAEKMVVAKVNVLGSLMVLKRVCRMVDWLAEKKDGQWVD
jgi:uncharacterized protein (UPF0548 family)